MWHWSCTEWQPALGKVKVSINQMSQPSAQPSFVNHRWNTTQLRLWFPVSSSGFRWSAFLSIFKSRERRGDQLSSSHSAVIKKKPLDYELWNSHIDVMFSLKQKNKKQMWVQAEVQRGDFHVLRLLLLSGRCISAPILAEVSAVSRWPVRAGRVSLKKNRIRRKQINTLRLCGS